VAVLALVVGLGDEARAEGGATLPTITVSASGYAEAEPDQADITSGVSVLADTARAALDENSAAMAKLIAGLKEAGVEAKNIQTSNLNVSPRYDNRNRREGPPEVIGYQVTNEVRVLVRDLDGLGEILDRMVSLGANQVRGLSFGVSKAEFLRDEARAQAIANARRRAELYAKAAGAGVGDVVQISEGGGHTDPRPVARARGAGVMEAVPVERGTQILSANVTVTWELTDE